MELAHYFIEPSKRFFIGYLVSAVMITLIWLWINKQSISMKSMTDYWLHPSARLDYAYFIVGGLIKIYAIMPLLLSAQSVMLAVNNWCIELFGYHAIAVETSRTFVIIAYTITLFIISDFSRYWLHRLMHAVPILWAFHKVHHSAEVLNPATFYRVHPIENILFGLRYALVIGAVTGLFIYLFGANVQLLDILGVNALLFAFNAIGGNLRHSHIELAYPKWLEKFFISPRQHQLHHSYYFTRFNYGGYLAIWDNLFGTLQLTHLASHIGGYGLGKQNHRYKHLSNLLIQPFKEVTHMIKPFINKKISSKLIIQHKSLLLLIGLSSLLMVIPLQAKEENPTTNTAPLNYLQSKSELGQRLFFDVNLSKNRTMSCASCHNPATGFVDQRDKVPNNMVSLGDDGHSLGDRNAPTAAYALFTPPFQTNIDAHKERSAFMGGMFWDGREPDLAGQAGGPPTNPIEMGMPNKASVVARIKENPDYVKQFQTIYGDTIFSDANKTYAAMTNAIAQFENDQTVFATFDSKYDRFLRGEYELTVLEDLGRSLFFSNANVNCSTCHKLNREDHPKEIFTNYEYHNIGIPENTALRKLNGVTNKDYGLWHNPKAQIPNSKGRFKVPTLRNTAVTAPYMHNGIFNDLRTVILFYDKYNNPERINNPETNQPWRDPEVKDNLALEELKAKKLTDRKVDALVAFLKTLTDKHYEHLLK